MISRKLAAAAAIALLSAGGFWASVVAADTPPPARYLSFELDTTHILQPAPVAGTARYEADRLTFLQTRSMKGSPRWAMAQGDADSSKVLDQFSCSAGLVLSKDTAPRLAALLRRMLKDVSGSTNKAKDFYQRPRPFRIDEGETCVDKPSTLDYPSGHTTWGWSVGLVLAELMPDRTPQILLRARAIGESRVVCGVHNASAVEAGRVNGSAVVAALHGQEAFRKDLDGVRKEIAELRKTGAAPDAGQCKAEADILAQDPY